MRGGCNRARTLVGVVDEGPDATRREVLAVDVGGTKLAVALVDDRGRVRGAVSVPTIGVDGVAVFEVLASLVKQVLARAGTGPGPLAVGVGCGGPMTADGHRVSPLNIPQWRDFPLHDRLAELTGLPVHVDNDAKALARGEGWIGAAAGVDDFLAMVVSTGVGGGIVLEGRLLHGAAGNAGHIGHTIVEPDGAWCECGARGCLEAEASGTAIARRTGRPAAEAPIELRHRTGRLVGRAVASVANLLDLRLAVVGGSVALGFGSDFFVAAQRELDRSCRIEFNRGARIIPAGLGADGPIVGAAAVAWAAVSGGRPGGPVARPEEST